MTKSAISAAPAPNVSHKDMANAIRFLSADAVQQANSGHPGMPMGMADVATVLFTRFLKFDPAHPHWPDRDRFVLSAGHGSMLLYSLLYLTGYADMTIEEIKNFRQLGAKTAGHPEYGHAEGIETTTGPLGQGVANAVGMALAERMHNARYGDEVVDHYTYAIAGDGCLMEGISQEAISLAGHLKLGKLIVLFDDNEITIDGPTSLSTSEDMQKRFAACNWHTLAIDGHDPDAITKAIEAAKKENRPSLICCKTTIGYGAPTKAGTAKTHGSPLGEDELAGARKKLGWDAAPFEVPTAILNEWRECQKRGHQYYSEWNKRFNALKGDTQQTFTRELNKELPNHWHKAFLQFKKELAEKAPKEATRQSSQNALEVLTEKLPQLVGGSADLTGSNNTKTDEMKAITAENYGGSYIYYGIREHGMAAAMNGIALHGGFIPYGGTFLVFTDYCRPSIRLSALMEQQVIYVMTHDSIGLGEDGPTHQPVEHLASLRAIPNLQVMRPADAVETAECWALAVGTPNRPSLLALSRQGLPALRTTHTEDNLCARGGYVLQDAKDAKVTLIATGSELHLATQAAEQLAKDGIAARVVSLPCTSLFDAQSKAYREEVLGSSLRIGIEAALSLGWDRYLGDRGIFIGMEGFGASAPAPDLYKHFGITTEAIVRKAKDALA